MNLHRLRCFIAVVDEGSVTKAAHTLQMTQPPLSILIRKFEEELGVQLFHRIGRRMELTASGRFLYEHGKELLDVAETTERQLVEFSEGIRGTINIGCITSANLFLLPQVIEKIQQQATQVTTSVLEGNSSFVIEELRKQTIDIGIVRTSVIAPDIHSNCLYQEPLYVALPPHHSLHNQPTISLTDLKNERFLLPRTSHGVGIAETILATCQQLNFTPNIVYWGSETLPMLRMVQKNAGICFAPACYQALSSPWLPTLKPLQEQALQTQLSIIYLRDRYQSPLTKRFIELIQSFE